jgi:hypothetical protein
LDLDNSSNEYLDCDALTEVKNDHEGMFGVLTSLPYTHQAKLS